MKRMSKDFHVRYENYALEDFLADDFFIQWVKNPRPESEYFWKSWLAKHPEKTAIITRAKTIVSSVNYKNHQVPSEDEYIETLEKIHKTYLQKTLQKETGTKRYFRSLLKYAASIMLLIATGSLGWILYDKYNSTRLSDRNNQPTEYRTKATDKGQKSTVVLADGSAVKLNAQSQIRFPEKFEPHVREVFLEGEAFFDVKEDAERPFIIRTGEITTKVLGTSFNIKANPNGHKIQVTVVSGKVQVNSGAKDQDASLTSAVLLPSEMLTFYPAEEKIVKEKVATHDFVAWKDGILVFKKATFKEVISELEAWYGVEISVNEIPADRRFSGEFNKMSLESVLKGIGFSLGFEYVIEGKTVKIRVF
ncbi:FecR domain-containing protein [Fulvivirgaceae bacterium BMA12]|uniref:FecR domain-containing protein n=1 Tax=Agaribacillus aureus TaxID=3051825 RepID=A0ABT8L863_9BACT|nr:FecR domain-containing protein [Fulvivirgaceae bacterium BMA12]